MFNYALFFFFFLLSLSVSRWGLSRSATHGKGEQESRAGCCAGSRVLGLRSSHEGKWKVEKQQETREGKRGEKAAEEVELWVIRLFGEGVELGTVGEMQSTNTGTTYYTMCTYT